MHRPTTITKLALFLVLSAVLVLAHGGLVHVMGTIANIADTSVTVTGTDGKPVVVLLDAKTTYSRNSQAIKKTDLKVGDKVVIHAEKDEKDPKKLTAKTVEIGATATAPSH
jgi:nitrate reductase NapAB chaperone NapD